MYVPILNPRPGRHAARAAGSVRLPAAGTGRRPASHRVTKLAHGTSLFTMGGIAGVFLGALRPSILCSPYLVAVCAAIALAMLVVSWSTRPDRIRNLIRTFDRPTTWQGWLHSQRWHVGRRPRVIATRPSEPQLELVGSPFAPDCILSDPCTGRTYLRVVAATTREGVLARGTGVAPYVADHVPGEPGEPASTGCEPVVRATIADRRVTSWEVIRRLVLPAGQELVELSDDWSRKVWRIPERRWQMQVGDRLEEHQRHARWVLPASAVKLRVQTVTRMRGTLPADALAAMPLRP